MAQGQFGFSQLRDDLFRRISLPCQLHSPSELHHHRWARFRESGHLLVVGYFRRASWVGWLGTVTLTISVYAALAFTWGAVAAGAPALGLSYLWLNIAMIPIVVLFVAWSYWATSRKLG